MYGALLSLGFLFAAVSETPYPQSQVITRLTWDKDVLKLKDGAGDNWPIAWVDDDLQITSYGDGKGFRDGNPSLTLGFARIFGDPPDHYAEDLPSDADAPMGGGPSGIKSSGMLMVDGVLYMFVRNYKPGSSDDYTNARLAWSTNMGVNWIWADWYFSDTFGCPDFVQFGKNYQGARDDYVYIASQANDDAYKYSPDIVMLRAPKDRVSDRESYEFFAGLASSGDPIWSSDIAERSPIFTDPQGTQRISINYNAALRRYILASTHQPPGSNATHTGALGVFDAPEPWGPWTTVYYDDYWSGDHRTYHHRFPTKWMSDDGRTMWLLFSGLDGGYYSFCLKKANLELSAR
ncbi:hypothetical protein ACFL6S_01405 [Candidatus Poribacteria bacterium]